MQMLLSEIQLRVRRGESIRAIYDDALAAELTFKLSESDTDAQLSEDERNTIENIISLIYNAHLFRQHRYYEITDSVAAYVDAVRTENATDAVILTVKEQLKRKYHELRSAIEGLLNIENPELFGVPDKLKTSDLTEYLAQQKANLTADVTALQQGIDSLLAQPGNRAQRVSAGTIIADFRDLQARANANIAKIDYMLELIEQANIDVTAQLLIFAGKHTTLWASKQNYRAALTALEAATMDRDRLQPPATTVVAPTQTDDETPQQLMVRRARYLASLKYARNQLALAVTAVATAEQAAEQAVEQARSAYEQAITAARERALDNLLEKINAAIHNLSTPYTPMAAQESEAHAADDEVPAVAASLPRDEIVADPELDAALLASIHDRSTGIPRPPVASADDEQLQAALLASMFDQGTGTPLPRDVGASVGSLPPAVAAHDAELQAALLASVGDHAMGVRAAISASIAQAPSDFTASDGCVIGGGVLNPDAAFHTNVDAVETDQSTPNPKDFTAYFVGVSLTLAVTVVFSALALSLFNLSLLTTFIIDLTILALGVVATSLLGVSAPLSEPDGGAQPGDEAGASASVERFNPGAELRPDLSRGRRATVSHLRGSDLASRRAEVEVSGDDREPSVARSAVVR